MAANIQSVLLLGKTRLVLNRLQLYVSCQLNAVQKLVMQNHTEAPIARALAQFAFAVRSCCTSSAGSSHLPSRVPGLD